MPPRPRALREAALDLTRRYIAAVYDRLDLTLAASPSTADLLRDCGVREVAVAPLGVDAARFHPSRRDPSWRRELDLPPDAPALLYAGRLCREKEVDVVMAAAPELHRRFGAVVVFVGAGHLGPEIDRLARELPAGVRRLEYQTDPDALARMLASADLYLAPFSYETFGLAALEAMASGVAVIASRSLALADLIDESCGRTFRPGDAGELVRAVGAALDAEPMALGRAARRRAEAYTWERTFERLLELYRAVAGHSSVPSERTSAAVGSARR